MLKFSNKIKAMVSAVLILGTILFPSIVNAQVFKAGQIITPTGLTVPSGVIMSTGSATRPLIASTTPTVGSIFASSTDGTSNFLGRLINRNIGVRLDSNYIPGEATTTALDYNRYDAFGMIAMFPSGKQFIAYRSGTSHVGAGDFGVIKIQFSTDNGYTWSASTTIASSAGVDLRNVRGGVTPTGRAIIGYNGYNPATSQTTGWWTIYSDDEGVTWSTPASQPCIDGCNSYGALISIGDGKLMLPFNNNTSTSSALFSSDDGTTWGGQVNILAIQGQQFNEGSFVYLGGGHILGLIRNEVVGPVGFRQVLSRDNGATWTDQGYETFETFTVTGPAWLSTFVNESGRRMVAAYYQNRDTRRINVIYGYGDDLIKGITGWNLATKTKIANLSGATGGGYPTVIHPYDSPIAFGWFYDQFSASDTSITFFRNSTPAFFGGEAGANLIALFKTASSTGSLSILNRTSQAGSFQPGIYGREGKRDTGASTVFGLELVGETASTTNDVSTSTPVISFDARNASTALSNRLILGIGSFIATNADYKMVIAASGNVGIGTSSPQRPLSIRNTGGNGHILLEDSGASANQKLGTLGFSRGNFSFNTMTDALASTTLFTILNGGNIGIGTTSPYAKLSVVGQTVSEYFTASSTTATSTFAGYLVVNGSTLFVDPLNNKLGIGTSTPWAKLSVNPDNMGTDVPEFVVGSSTATHLVVRGNGFVGIGSTTPRFGLSVMAGTGILNPGVYLKGTSGAGAFMSFAHATNPSTWVIGTGLTTTDDFIIRDTSATTRLLITNAGNFGFGTSTPVNKLTVVGEIGFFSTIPVLSSAGSGATITKGSTDSAGEITEGTLATGAIITFGSAKTNTPFCTVTSQAGLSFSYTVSTTAITITNIGALSSTKLNYICIANNN